MQLSNSSGSNRPTQPPQAPQLAPDFGGYQMQAEKPKKLSLEPESVPKTFTPIKKAKVPSAKSPAVRKSLPSKPTSGNGPMGGR